MKNVYDLFMAPFEKRGLSRARREILQQTQGDVLEIGGGTGVNLTHYPYDQMSSLLIVDTNLSEAMQTRAKEKEFACPVSLLEMNVEELPFEGQTFDTIVVTLVFCSVDDVEKGLRQIRRVLKDDGMLLFMEHVLPEKNPLRKIFGQVSPLWERMASGCHLNRDFASSLKENGFQIENMTTCMKSVFICGTAKKTRNFS